MHTLRHLSKNCYLTVTYLYSFITLPPCIEVHLLYFLVSSWFLSLYPFGAQLVVFFCLVMEQILSVLLKALFCYVS